MIDTSVLSFGNLALSVVSGAIAGLYLAVFHPAVPGTRALVRRSILQGWYFGFLGSILYIARIAFAVAGHQSDLPRVTAGWFLWLLFAVCIAGGAMVGALIRDQRSER